MGRREGLPGLQQSDPSHPSSWKGRDSSSPPIRRDLRNGRYAKVGGTSLGARAGVCAGRNPSPQAPEVGSHRDLYSRSILSRLYLGPLPGLWLRSVDRFGEWPAARGGRGKREEVVKETKRSSRASRNCEERSRPSCPKAKKQGYAG